MTAWLVWPVAAAIVLVVAESWRRLRRANALIAHLLAVELGPDPVPADAVPAGPKVPWSIRDRQHDMSVPEEREYAPWVADQIL